MGITKGELELLLGEEYAIEKTASLSSDGKNLLVRIPKEIRERLELKKGDKLKFLIKENKNFGVEILK